MTKAVAYVRVSSKEQKEEGYSIPAQKRLLWEFAKKNSLQIVQEFEDNETAKKAGRTNFGLMVEFLKKNKEVKTILVEKTDRLYRNFKDYVIIDELEISVYLVKENEKIGKDASSHQKFIHGIKVLMAKNHIDNLSEESRKGLTEKAESGIYPSGSVPVGYKTTKESGKSVPVVDEENKDLVIRLFQYYATGFYSLDSLIAKVESEGFKISDKYTTQKHGKGLVKSMIHRVLRNRFYFGEYVWAGKIYAGTHEPLIPKELWDNVQKILDKRKDTKTAQYNNINFTYKGLFTCGECGRTITAERKTKPSGREYVYYHCTKYHTNCQQEPIEEKGLDEQIKARLEGLKMPQETILYITEGLRQSHSLKRNTEDKVRDNLVEEKAKYQQRLDALYEDKLDGNITSDFYKIKAGEYEANLKQLDTKISQYTQTDIDYYKMGSNILELAQTASFLYENGKPEEKRELLSFLLQNSTLKDGSPCLDYKKPFDRVYQRALCSDWLRG